MEVFEVVIALLVGGAVLAAVARQVGVPVAKGRRLPSGGYDITHGTQVLGVNGAHDVPVVWTLGTTAPEFASDIHQLLS